MSKNTQTPTERAQAVLNRLVGKERVVQRQAIVASLIKQGVPEATASNVTAGLVWRLQQDGQLVTVSRGSYRAVGRGWAKAHRVAPEPPAPVKRRPAEPRPVKAKPVKKPVKASKTKKVVEDDEDDEGGDDA